MLKSKVLLALVAFSLCGVSIADDQIDKDLKKGEEKVRTLSIVEKDIEKVYSVTAEEAKNLPKGDQSKATADQKKKIEATLASITSRKPYEVKVNKTEEEATKACGWYGNYYYNYYPRYYCPNYYYGGGFYGAVYNTAVWTYRTVWNYYGYYNSPYYSNCYYGW